MLTIIIGIFFVLGLQVEIAVKAQDLFLFEHTGFGTPVFEGTTPKRLLLSANEIAGTVSVERHHTSPR
jgi:hypothetical protein